MAYFHFNDEQTYHDYKKNKFIFLRENKNTIDLQETSNFIKRYQHILWTTEDDEIFFLVFKTKNASAILDLTWNPEHDIVNWHTNILSSLARYYSQCSALDDMDGWIHHLIKKMSLLAPEYTQKYQDIFYVEALSYGWEANKLPRIEHMIQTNEWKPHWSDKEIQRLFSHTKSGLLPVLQKIGIDFKTVEKGLHKTGHSLYEELSVSRGELLGKLTYLYHQDIRLENLSPALFIQIVVPLINAIPKDDFQVCMSLMDFTHSHHQAALEEIKKLIFTDELGGEVLSHPLQRYEKIVRICLQQSHLERTLGQKKLTPKNKI